jgi:hypothetical protein
LKGIWSQKWHKSQHSKPFFTSFYSSRLASTAGRSHPNSARVPHCLAPVPGRTRRWAPSPTQRETRTRHPLHVRRPRRNTTTHRYGFRASRTNPLDMLAGWVGTGTADLEMSTRISTLAKRPCQGRASPVPRSGTGFGLSFDPPAPRKNPGFPSNHLVQPAILCSMEIKSKRNVHFCCNATGFPNPPKNTN